MRPSLRFLAKVNSGTPKYLEANTQTGLTGLTTHPAPRPALILTYRQTLEKLKQLPSWSVYRQSAEAIAKHRLAIVESTKPEGHDEWLVRVRKQIAANPGAYASMKHADGSYASERVYEAKSVVWDGQVTRGSARAEGANTEAAANEKGRAIRDEIEERDRPDVRSVDELEEEPRLSADQYV